MPKLDRREFLGASVAGAAAMSPLARAIAESASLQEIGSSAVAPSKATIYIAREIVTLDETRPIAEAVAVVGDRILMVGRLDEILEQLGEQPYGIDERFADHIIVPGFIAQHDHPVLGALSMSAEILSIEDWDLPTGRVLAVKDKPDFMERLAIASDAMEDPDAPLLSWGYHPAFYGKLTRADLDTISTTRPILIWARSCHEMTLNTAALGRAGVSAATLDGFTPSGKAQSNIEEAHFWEQGLFAVLPHIAAMVSTPERFQAGLEITRDFMHAKGITFGNEPGGILSKQVQDSVNAVFSSSDMPFRWSFIVDAKSMVTTYKDDTEVIAQSEALASWYGGMTSLAPKQAKLFADGAIYSLLMKVREAYLDEHEGEWMMDLDDFERAFRVYWDAGYQIHIHVNGDAGLDRVLDTLETNMQRNPRDDHRTVIVHFAVSADDQVARIRDMGAIVSGNPYYVTALADQYSKVGLGAERADTMVRLGDVTSAGIPWSLHSDMPMAPCDPLFLMWCAVNRVTASGRVAGPEQRVSAEAAMRGVTLEAAYALKLEDEIGSIVPGKRANFTVLTDNPLNVDPMTIREIDVWGTVMEGRILPVHPPEEEALRISPPHRPTPWDTDTSHAALHHALKVTHTHL